MKYQIVLKFNDGKEVNGVLLDEKPSKEQIAQAVKLYKADGYILEEVNTIKR